jgi:hypothetical protein
MQVLGWLSDSIRTMIQANAAITIREAIGEGPALQCEAEDRGKIFATKANLIRDYSQDHPGDKRKKLAISHQQLFQTVMISERQMVMAPKRRVQDKADRPRPQDEEMVQIRQGVERRRRRHSNPLQPGQSRQTVESQRFTEYMEQRQREFKQKREEYCNNIAERVNIPQTTQAEMRKVRSEFVDLFKTMVNPLIKEFQPKRDDWEGWQPFEGAYEKTMHLLRLHMMKPLNRKSETKHDQRRVSAQIQKAQAEQNEPIFTNQEIQRRLRKVKSMLESRDEGQEDSAAGRRKQTRIVGERYQFLNLTPLEARGEVFGEKDLEAILGGAEQIKRLSDNGHQMARSEDHG